MKFGFILVAILVSGWAFEVQAIEFERLASCGSWHYQTSNLELKGTNFKQLTAACSLYNAANEGLSVCTSPSFGWLRPNGGTPLQYVKSTIGKTSCRQSKGLYSCETAVKVECR
jgi:hypothetical protein